MADQIWRNTILFNKSKLCDLTTIHLRFLDRCVELEILTRHEKDVISKSQLDYDQNSTFYDIILRKSETVFTAMTLVMMETENRQSNDVLEILQNWQNTRVPRVMTLTLASQPGPSGSLRSTMCDLSLSPLPSSIQRVPIWFDVVQPLVEVVGRDKELVNLHKLVTRNSGNENLVTITSQMTCVSGLGGIGKTTLVRKYVFDYREYFNGNVIWIKADNKQQIQNSFGKLISRLKLEKKSWENPEETVSEILEYFGDRNSLFVFDNVEEYFGVMDKFLPLNLGPDMKKPYILMTTRKDGFGQKIKNFKLGVLSRDNAAILITNELELDCEEDKTFAFNLVDQLECLPLAIQQAISYIQKLQKEKQQFDREWNPIEHYLKLLEENNQAVLEFDYCRETNDDYKNTVFRTWITTMTRISDNEAFGKTAKFIMKLLAHFNPDSISLHILDSIQTKYIVQKSLSLLAEYSMIEIDKGFISIHRLVQQVIRIQNKTTESELLKECLTILAKHPDALEHFFTVWKSTLNYDELVHEFPRIGLRLCEKIHFGCDSVEIFQGTSDKFIQVFGSDSVFTIELDCIRIISLCHDMRKPDYDLILQLFDNLIIRVKSSSAAHISVLFEILQRLVNSLTKVGIGMWPLYPMTSRIEVLQKLLSNYQRTTKEKKVKRLATSFSALTVGNQNQFRLRRNLRISNLAILRRNELLVLHSALTERVQRDQLVVTNIYGSSGVGKTSFIHTYIEEFASFYEGVIWVNFHSKETAIRSLVEASKTLKLKLFPFGETYSWSSIELQCRLLLLLNSKLKTYLVIFLLNRANDGQYGRLVKIFNHYICYNPHVIILSRNEQRHIFQFEVNVIHLNGFETEDSMYMMLKHLNPTTNNILLPDILSEKLRRFPLALHYAIKYIAKQTSAIKTTESEPIKEYLELIEKHMTEVLKRSSKFSAETFEESVQIVWSIAKSKIATEQHGCQSEAILNAISYLDPENISIGLVESIIVSPPNHTTRECLKLLDEYGLITFRKSAVSIHPLLQKVIRKHNKISEYDTLTQILNNANFDSTNQSQLIFLWRQFSGQMENCQEHCWDKQDVNILREMLEKFESVFGPTNRYTIKTLRHGILTLNRPDCPDQSYLLSLCQKIIQKLEGFSSNETGSFTSNNIKKIFPMLPFKILCENTEFVDAEIQLYNAQFEFDKRINNFRINFLEYLEGLINCLMKCERTDDILAVAHDFETLVLTKDNSNYCGRQMISLASCLLDIGRNDTEIKCDILINEAFAIPDRVKKFYTENQFHLSIPTYLSLLKVKIVCSLLLQSEDCLQTVDEFFEEDIVVNFKINDDLHFEIIKSIVKEIRMFGYRGKCDTYSRLLEEKHVPGE